MIHDVLIIGGGIAGLSAAARLAPGGSVLVLEAEDHLAYHASGRSAALYEPWSGAAPVVALSRRSGDFFRSIPGLLAPRGLMVLGRADQTAVFEQDCKDLCLDPISLPEALGMVPILNPATVAKAGFADHAWDIDTGLLIQTFAREARNHGAEILTRARVTEIRRARHWIVHTARETFEASLLINAAGAWADAVARMAGVPPLGFQPMRRSMARVPAPGGHDVRRWPMILGCSETWYAKPDAGGLIISPAEEHPMDPGDVWACDLVLAEGIARYEQMVTEPVTRLIANWAGLRTFAPDRVPVIGRDPGQSDFFWLAGQGGAGFQSAPAASQLVADMIEGRLATSQQAWPATLLSALSPARFRWNDPAH